MVVRCNWLQGFEGALDSVHLNWLHQGWAVVFLGFAVAHWRGFHGAYPLETAVEVRT